MNIAEKAYQQLYPEKVDSEGRCKFNIVLSYSGHFKEYGANICLMGSTIHFKLSKSWKGVDESIRIGLLQELLVKLFKTKKTTTEMDFYNSFLRNLHKTIRKTDVDGTLKASFDRVNDKYFSGLVEMPNLVFGEYSRTKFGSYDYRTDTIRMSRLLDDSEDKGKTELLDYVMYHEMLHKKHSFRSKNGQNRYHTSKFRNDERMFENADEAEKKLSRLAAVASFRIRKHSSSKKRRGFFDWIFG